MVSTLPQFFRDRAGWLISNQFVIAFSALCLSLETFVLCGHPVEFHPVHGLVFFGSLAVYNLAFLGSRPFSDAVPQVKKPAALLFIIALPVSIGFMMCLPLDAIFYCLISAAGGIVYLYTISLKQFEFQVRNIPLVKNMLLAFIWSMITVMVPVASFDNQNGLPQDTLLIFLRRFFFILAIAIPYDIRDFNADTRDRLRTLPVVIGIYRSRMVAILSLLVFVALVYHDPVNPGAQHLNEKQVSLALYLSALFTGIIILFASSFRRKIFFSLLLDGSMIVQFLLLMLILNLA